MGTGKRMATICVLAAMLTCALALPAAAATVTVVQGRLIGCNSGQVITRVDSASGTTIRYIKFSYRDPRTGNTVYYWYRVTIPGYRFSTPEPVPAPKPGPAPQPQPQPEPTPTPAPQPVPSGLTAEEQQMFNLVNKERTAAGLKPLELDMRLVQQARLKSQDMSKLGYFDHYSPTYGSPFDQMKKAGITYRAAGENLAGAPTVQMAHEGLMNSPGHRANILNSMFTHVGIGVASSSKYGLLFTQMFIAK